MEVDDGETTPPGGTTAVSGDMYVYIYIYLYICISIYVYLIHIYIYIFLVIGAYVFPFYSIGSREFNLGSRPIPNAELQAIF